MFTMTLIYTLKHPITQEIRYVGLTTTTLNDRLIKHIHAAKYGKRNHRKNWINSLLKEELKPIIELLDKVSNDEKWYWETFWIKQLKSWNYRLVNSTDGGEAPLTKPGKENPNYGNKYRVDLKTTKDKVVQLDKSGNYIRTLLCSQEGEIYGLSPNSISLCVNGKRSQHKGFQFIYEPLYNKDIDYTFKYNNTQQRPVVKLTDDLSIIEEFKTARLAGGDSIGRVCRGERKTYKGYKWMFKDDWIKI